MTWLVNALSASMRTHVHILSTHAEAGCASMWLTAVLELEEGGGGWGDGDRQIPGTLWLDSLTETVSSRFRERSSLKT